ncbi:glycosyltransferase family 2 protein [Streptomyces sp. NPDC017941]|uniref:glycosyltransferase family 2 protein n=1 Tax=unclassified Streptomyces TaxID=2593676 RepID=UPI0037B59B13
MVADEAGRIVLMPVISIITPVHPAGAAYLPTAYQSLARQEIPPGWTWEWIIQEDGEAGHAQAHLPIDSRIRVASSRHGGPHVARTVALGRSSGDLIKTFDSDDVMADGALRRDIGVLTEHRDVGWTTSRVLDLHSDGRLSGFDGDPPAGRIPRGSIFPYWEQTRRAQVHPATMCARRHLIMALGGWMALPSSGDTGLLLGLDALADGWFTAEVGLHYRKHQGQITAHSAHSSGPEWEARMSVIAEHARAVRLLLGDEAGRSGERAASR